LVLDGKTIWWLRVGQKQGFESMAVFNTYGFNLARVVTANNSDKTIPEGPIIKFRDGTLINDGGTVYFISDGVAQAFSSPDALNRLGYNQANAINSSLAAYTRGNVIQ
jgi:hypothetical protein